MFRGVKPWAQKPEISLLGKKFQRAWKYFHWLFTSEIEINFALLLIYESHLPTGTSSYSMSESLFVSFTLLMFPPVIDSTFDHLSISILMCSRTTLAWAFLMVMRAPSLTISNYWSLAIIMAHPCSSPTRHSADLLTVPSYLLLSLVILTDSTLRCIVTLVPGCNSFMVTKVGFWRTIGSFSYLLSWVSITCIFINNV